MRPCNKKIRVMGGGGGGDFLLQEKARGRQCSGGFEPIHISPLYGGEIFSGDRPPHYHDSAGEDDADDDDDSGSNESRDTTERRTIYWESQDSLLQEILDHYSSSGSKLRQEIKRLIEMARNEAKICTCPNPKPEGCVKCLRPRVVNLLCNQGFNAALCISKWNKTKNFPGGKHEYIEVIASTQSRRKQIPFLIELGFRDEFKMAKACDEYNDLINQLPEIFIGKPEHLHAVVRLVCDAAKRSTAEKKMHMGPWRKKSFMQRKWSASQDRRSTTDQSSNELHLIASGEELISSAVRSGFQFSFASAVKVA